MSGSMSAVIELSRGSDAPAGLESCRGSELLLEPLKDVEIQKGLRRSEVPADPARIDRLNVAPRDG